jgi:hypothetical protein
MWVLSQHGIEPTTAESIWASLTTGNDPMPNGVPITFTFQGIALAYPTGVGARLLYPAERKALNAALKRNGNDLLDSEDNAEMGRRAYEALYRKTRQEGYVDPTSTKARMDALITEACTETEPVTIQRLTTKTRTVKAQTPQTHDRAEELDDLLAQLNTLTAQAL